MSNVTTRGLVVQAVIDGFGQLKRLMRSQYGQAFVDIGLSSTQLELLITIRQVQPVSHKALAASLQLTPGAVSQLLDGLDRQGCIMRTPNPSDRRVSYVSLSREGKYKLDEFQVVRKRLFSQAFATLDDEELDNYLHVQQKIITWLEDNQHTNK